MAKKFNQKLLYLFSFLIVVGSFNGVASAQSSFFEANSIPFIRENEQYTTCEPSQVGPIPGDNNLQKVYNYFLKKGLTKDVSAAIVGNISVESKGDPLILQTGGRTNDPSKVGLYKDGSMFENKPGQKSLGKAWGLLQWDPGNAALYWQKQAGITGDISKLETQLDLAWWHLNNRAPTSKNNVLATMKAASTLQAATAIMVKDYFGAGVPAVSERIKAATIALTYPVDPSIDLESSENSLDCDNSGVSTPIAEGGLTEGQAKVFVMNYGKNKNNSTKDAMRESSWRSCGGGYNGGGSNCVSFSEFFLNKFTNTKAPDPMGNGHQVVGKLASKGLSTGREPRVGAIFSIADGGYGHTGVVLGIQGDTIIVGHASCNRGNKGKRGVGDGTSSGQGSAFIKVGKVTSRGSDVWWGRGAEDIIFAYPEVNNSAIEAYLANGV